MSAHLEPVSDHLPPTSSDPDPEWVVGTCPQCGGPCVSNSYYIGGRGYIIRMECWNSLTGPQRPIATCDYRRVV